MSLAVSIKMKKLFFDRTGVASRVHEKRRITLNRAGGKLRTIARRSISYTKWNGTKTKRSKAGSPPKAHVPSRGFGIKLIIYHYDNTSDGVIIGPVGSNRGRAGMPPVTSVLEHGGPIKVFSLRTKRPKLISQAPRPFMGPAKAVYEKSYPKEWKWFL